MHNPRLVLRTDFIQRVKQEHSLKTDAEVAAKFGIDRSTFSRYANGQSPSGLFVAKIIKTFGVTFSEAFTTVVEVETDKVPA